MSKYTAEMLAFMAKKFKENTVSEVTAMVNEKFGTDFRATQIKSTLKRYGIKSGRTASAPKGRYILVTREQGAWIQKTYLTHSRKETLALFNEKFGADLKDSQLKTFLRNHRMHSGRTGRFRKGHTPHNAGVKGWTAGGNASKTQFKKGCKPVNHRPVGSTRICSKDGYVIMKVSEPGKWRPKHTVEWEKINGPVPRNHCLWFKDGNRENWKPENMMLISRAQMAVINKMGLGNTPEEAKDSVILLADIRMAQRSLVKKGANHA